MLAAHEERFRRIYRDYLERPGGDYAELLRRGEVISREGVDPEAWRAEIRRMARQDKLRITTARHGQRASATLQPSVPYDPELVRHRYLQPVAERLELGDQSSALGHDLAGFIRDGDEYISWCQRCGARIYAQLSPPDRIEDGEALTHPCPARQPAERAEMP